MSSRSSAYYAGPDWRSSPTVEQERRRLEAVRARYYAGRRTKEELTGVRREAKRLRAERAAFARLTPSERAALMAERNVAYSYRGSKDEPFVGLTRLHAEGHGNPSHHLGKCNAACRRGDMLHAHRVRSG